MKKVLLLILAISVFPTQSFAQGGGISIGNGTGGVGCDTILEIVIEAKGRMDLVPYVAKQYGFSLESVNLVRMLKNCGIEAL